ncbi:MAG: CBS domain-containing protein, partial [Burkholderiales bacterium]|nr:CBS domain-containing protein [Burkholderiales bacterium]
MYSQRIRAIMDPAKLLTAPPDTSVSAAAGMLAAKNVGALLVVEGGRLAGIFTERDAVYRVMAQGRDPSATQVSEVMTREPFTIGPNETFGRALVVMHERCFRHMPVVEQGVPVGIVSARHALDPDLEEFVSEAQRR